MKRRIWAMLVAVCLVLTLAPTAWAANLRPPIYAYFYCTSAAFDGEIIPDLANTLVEIEGGAINNLTSLQAVLEDIQDGTIVDGDGITFTIDFSKPFDIRVTSAFTGETINKKVIVSGQAGAVNANVDSDAIMIPGTQIIVGTVTNQEMTHTITFAQGIEVRSDAALILNNALGTTAATMNYVFGGDLAVSGTLSTSSERAVPTTGTMTFGNGSALKINPGGAASLISMNITGGSTTAPLIENAGTLMIGVGIENRDTPVPAVTAGGTAVKNTGTLTLDACDMSTSGTDTPLIVCDSGTVEVKKVQETGETSADEIRVSTLTAPENAPAIQVNPGAALVVTAGKITSDNADQPAVVVEDGGSITISKDDSRGLSPSITTSSGAKAVDLAPGSTVQQGDKNITVSEESRAGESYVDNDGVIHLAAGSTVGDETLAGGGTVDTDGTVTPNATPADGVTLNQTSLTLDLNGTAQLTATVTPDNATDKVMWSSDNEAVAKVDQNGVVTAVGYGTATITATAGDKTASCAVTVSAPYVPVPPIIPVQPVTPTQPTQPDTPDMPDIPAPSYADVSANDWFYDEVAYVTAKGLMTGTTAANFAPDSNMSRAMVWTVLARMSGQKVEGGEPWYSLAQSWAVTGGVSDGTEPNGPITREELAAMLYRYAGSPAVGLPELAKLGQFTDGETVSDWAQEAMAWAVSTGIVTGSNGAILPQQSATRAQVAAMLMRFCETLHK